MWKRSDIEEGARYRVCLMYEGRRRYFLLLKLDEPLPEDGCFAVTEEVPTDLLLRRDFVGISKAVALATGDRFYVDAHGLWLAQREVDYLMGMNRLPADASVDSPWVTPEPPRFAPR